MSLVLRLTFVGVVASLAASGCGATSAASGLRVEDAWARAAQQGATTAVYLTVVNSGASADRLLRAASAAGESLQIHETSVMPGDVVHMQPVPDVEIPAGGRVEFQPGGLHLMLTGLRSQLNAGDSLSLTLVFETAGEVELQVEVLQP